jgi:predicted MFS family arabinose efflux permease
MTRPHYAWIVVGAIFLTLLVAAGVRSSPSVLIVPLEHAFGWSRTTISAAISINIVLYGLAGPFAAAVMQRFGIRRTVICALALIVAGLLLSTQMTEPWQLIATWGFTVGTGTGAVAMVLGATVVNRWFVERRGLAMGLLSASTASGQLVFLPGLAAVAESKGWQPVILIVAAAAALVIPVIYFLVPERPSSIGVRPYGATEDDAAVADTGNPFWRAIDALIRASRSRDFWLLFATFFVCGFSTNGLIGTHLIANCLDNGITEVSAASLLAVMGVFDLFGTTASGWLSDRYDNRKLLFWYYGLRGLSLIYLPFSGYGTFGLSVFAVFYGLDWLATVPPTTRLTTDAFGKIEAPIVFGWISVGHQLGAATAALGAGIIRSYFDAYLAAFVISGIACIIAACLALLIGRGRKTPELQPA